MIVIDGSFGEGGGQILRTSVALSAVTMTPIKIINIRAKRKPPGLRRQHLTAVLAVGKLVDAEIKGAEVGSTELIFVPRRRVAGTFYFDIGTAGSIPLVLQAVIPTSLFAPSEVNITIRGGTDVPLSPPIDYMRFVFKPIIEKFGANIEIILKRRGHYPKGGGIVELRVTPVKQLHSVTLLERGAVKAIRGLSHCVKLPKHVALRQAKAAEEYLKKFGYHAKIDLEWYEPSRDPHLGPGSGIVLWAITENSVLGGDSIGKKGKPAERVGEEAARKLLEDLSTGAALDRHMSDMIIPYAALACGKSEIGGAKLTMHAWTHVHIVKRIIPELKFDIEGTMEKPFKIKVEGVCLKSL